MGQIDFREIKDKVNLGSLRRPLVLGLSILFFIAIVACLFIFGQSQQSGIQIEATHQQENTQAQEEQASVEAASTIFVHIAGCVNSPGLLELPADARVAQAVEQAGGFTEQADTSSVNLARQLSDGEQLFVTSASGSESTPEAATSSASSSGVGGQVVSASSTQKVNINRASESELVSLPGIGESTAKKIVSDRTAHGSFATVDDLTRVSGIGEKKLEALRDLICV